MAKKRPVHKKRSSASGAGRARATKRKAAAVQASKPARSARFRASGRSGAAGLKRTFPKLLSIKSGTGAGALLAVAMRSDAGLRVRSVAFEETAGAARSRNRKRAGAICPDVNETARLLRGLAHAERLRILEAMRLGARKHIEIKAAVKLAAGPLYHHLRELERSSLVECPARNDYVLTESGRCALLIVSGLSALSAKSRRTSPWKVECFQQRLPNRGRSQQNRLKSRR